MKIRALFFFLFGSIAFAQADRATVTGTFRDSSGGAVAGVKVNLLFSATGLLSSVSTNESGLYMISGLAVGDMVLTADRPADSPRIENSHW